MPAPCAGKDLTHDPENCGACGHSCGTAGTCESGLCRAADVGTGLVLALDIVVDDAHVYTISQSMVYRMPLAGGEVSPVAVDANYFGLALDAVSVFTIRSTEEGPDPVLAISKASGEVRTLGAVHDGIDLAVDDGNLYIAALQFDKGPSNEPPPAAIFRLPKVGGELAVLAEHVGHPAYLVAHDEHVYFVDLNTRRVMRLSKRGGAPEAIAESPVDIVGLAAAAGKLFYSDDNDKLFEVPLAGGAPQLVHADARRFTAAGHELYWVAKDGLISRRAADGQVASITRVDAPVTDLEVRGDFLYVALDNSRGPRSSRIVRVAR